MKKRNHWVVNRTKSFSISRSLIFSSTQLELLDLQSWLILLTEGTPLRIFHDYYFVLWLENCNSLKSTQHYLNFKGTACFVKKKVPRAIKWEHQREPSWKLLEKVLKNRTKKVANFIIKSKRCFAGRYEFMMKEWVKLKKINNHAAFRQQRGEKNGMEVIFHKLLFFFRLFPIPSDVNHQFYSKWEDNSRWLKNDLTAVCLFF